ncbi:HAD family hydrolase [Acholeplasma sp. OttesenSCG-928-E16]|nr:HAD family hydrolase [Acholeplasma sp. OttesenSCG-928-E16]
MKLIVTDFDLTLFRNYKELNQTIEFIEQFREKGNKFVVATGRSLFSLKNILGKINLPFDYLILCNGALILDDKYKLIKSYELNKDILSFLTKKYEHNKVRIEYTGEDMESTNLSDMDKIFKMKIKSDDLALIDKIKNDIQKKYTKDVNAFLIPVEKGGLIDIVSFSTNKATAVSFILKNENCNMVYVIGDSENDVDMIKRFNGFAINTAKKEALSASTKVYDSVIDLIKENL